MALTVFIAQRGTDTPDAVNERETRPEVKKTKEREVLRLPLLS